MLSLRTNIEAVLHKHLDKLQALKPGGKTLTSALQQGADAVLIASRERIHLRGQGSDAAAIGTYDQKPMYVPTSARPAPGEAVGKRGATTFANGRERRSRYLPGGYNEYKTLTSQNTGSVNLVLTGELRDGYQLIQTTEGYGLGWTDEALRERADALEAKYGKSIWHPTDEERATLKARIAQCIKGLV